MNTYYLFLLKDKCIRHYKNKPEVLYKVFENLNTLSRKNYEIGISIFNQICDPFACTLLKNYITEKVPCKIINNKFIKIPSFLENTSIFIGYSRIKIYTDTKNPEIFKLFNIYNKNIFVCDFNNNKYFYLNELYR